MLKPFILGLRSSQPHAPFMSTEELYSLVGHNTGNLAFHYAIGRHIGETLSVADWGAHPDEIDACGDIAVLPCANQLGPHADLGNLVENFVNIKAKMVALGLGAQGDFSGNLPNVPNGTVAWVRSLIDHSPADFPNIGVRGEFTLNVLEGLGISGSAVVLGCPTLFINPSVELGRIISEKVREPSRIAVAAGHHRWRHLAKLEASLTALAKATGGSYIGQSPLQMVKLTRGEAHQLSEEDVAACRDYACPEMSIGEFVDWTARAGNVFFDVPSWMEHYRRFDFVIGTRIHGVMLALQAGVPALCIAHDSRTLELCQTMKVPYVLSKDVVGGIQRKDLLRLFQFDPDEFDANRRMLARRYVDFLKNNQLQPVDWLEGIAAAG